MPLSTLLRHLGIASPTRQDDAGLAAGTEGVTTTTLRARTSDPGLPALAVDALLASHADLLSRIKLCYGADQAGFQCDILSPVRRLASYVNGLPATADNYFCEPGGLFQLALEVGFYALQGTDGHIVSGRATISTRRELEPRWRHATFLAGLCCDLHRTLGQVVVSDEHGHEWPAFLGPLTDWLAGRRSERFFIRWIAKAPESRALGLYALPHVVSAQTLQHLATGNVIVVPQLLASVAGIPVYNDQNVLVELVKRATALVIDRNLTANANRQGRALLGAHIERYLVDAMRRLVVSHPAWLPNQEKSRVWHGPEGLFIVWPNAASELRHLLEEDALPGIPRSPEAILDCLLAAGVALPCGDQRPLWRISPPPGHQELEAIRLAAPEILLPGDTEHRPLAQRLVAAAHATPATSRTGDPSDPGDLPAGPPSAPEASPRRPDQASEDEGEPSDTTITMATTAPVARPRHGAAPLFRLVAPMRLQPQVRDALAAAVDSMNGDPRLALAVTVPAGVFLPLDHFRQAGVDPPVALRALAELGMVATTQSGRTETVAHDLGGREHKGLVLRPQFVQGLDPACFLPAGPATPAPC